MHATDPAVRVRLSRMSDLAAIDALLARSYPVLLKPDYPPSVLVLALPRIVRAQPALVGSGRYYLAEDGAGAVLAAGGWSMTAPGAGPARRGVAHVRHVVTDPNATRRGLARAVLDAAMSAARNAGADRMECLSTRTAVPFYQAMGFAAMGPRAVSLAPGIVFPSIEMHRRL